MLTLKLLKVTGNSMHPTLASGVFVVVWRWRLWRLQQRLKVDDIVAVEHRKYGQIIKRISQLRYDANGNIAALRLRGDNLLASVSEAQMGWVDAKAVLGKVVYVIK